MKTQRSYRALMGYIITFVVIILATGCDGEDTSSSNNPPPDEFAAPGTLVHADTGDIIAVRVNQNVTLDGSASTTTSTDPLRFAWSFTYKPYASNAELQNPTSAKPGFFADVPGTYMVQLVVSAGNISSQRAIALIEVTISGNVTGKRVHTSYSSQCANCHDGRFAKGDGPIPPVLPKSSDHLATSNMCEACHTTFGFDVSRHTDHLEVFGNCSSCHNGVLAIGKSEFHTKTNVECDSCHNTISFLELGPDGKYDHSSITKGCSSCHNGAIAIGKHELHSPTPPDTDCGFCHTTDNFKDAYVDHSGPEVVGKRCDSCHGKTAIGPKAGHPVMAVDCDICHNVTGFSLGGTFNHQVVVLPIQCADCHNDNNSINARGKSSATNHVPTGADCGACHNTVDFAGAFVDHTLPEVVSKRCDSCHDGAIALGQSTNHMPTIKDCVACHTLGTFTSGIFDHDPIVVDPITCKSCHDGVITAGKHVDHILTTEDCRACHFSTDTFAGAVFDHTNITNNCASCHNGEISTGKHATHMPTTQDCSDCHVIKFDNFTGGSFDHQGVSNNCASCHDGVIALGKKVNHIPALVECSQCHTNTTKPGGFASSIFLTDVHPGLSGGCEGCHISKFLSSIIPPVIKATNHLPTVQDCHFCHTNDTFTPQIFTHKDISGNCSSCHNGDYVVPAGAKEKTPDHVATNSDCGVCHNIKSFVGGFVDHSGPDVVGKRCDSCHGVSATGKNTGHVPTSQDCDVCHVPGTFVPAVFDHTDIVDNCASCHGGATPTATIKPGNHLPTTKDCSECHNTTAFAGAKFDHQNIVDNCVVCHDGNIARGKLTNHVPTNKDCSVCHLTTGFIPGTFDHVEIVDNCQSCHNGIFAQGKKEGHVQTSLDCGLCHNISGFIPATYDHSSVSTTTRCDSCHGVTSTGKSADHFATSLDCRPCHTTATFVGGTWLHDDSAIGTCDSCHSANGGARDKPKDHFSTDVQCDVCHSTDGWAPTIFSHDTQGKYPGDHNNAPGCSACHGNIVTIPFVYPPASDQYAPFCAACHAGDFEREGDHNGGENGTVEANKDCSGGGKGCHKVTDKDFG